MGSNINWQRHTWSLGDRLRRRLSRVGTKALHCLPAELAHNIGMYGLEKGYFEPLLTGSPLPSLDMLRVKLAGVGDLKHPVGLAAGFDKDCRTPGSFAQMGFSFLEIGTVTPRPQSGNPQPRMFRLPDQRALINRMGFNSKGAAAVARNLEAYKWDHRRTPLGVNLGKNKTTPADQALDDFMNVFESFRQLGRYFVVNLSSPNTPGLRDLANRDFISALADAVGQSKHMFWVKLDPDSGKSEFQKNIEAVVEAGFQGVVLTNTRRVSWPEAGGLSGSPLNARSCSRLEWAYEVHKGALQMIGVGGISTGIDVYERLIRGANAVQLYTALVYRGPWAVAEILLELMGELKLRGFDAAADAIGYHYS